MPTVPLSLKSTLPENRGSKMPLLGKRSEVGGSGPVRPDPSSYVRSLRHELSPIYGNRTHAR